MTTTILKYADCPIKKMVNPADRNLGDIDLHMLYTLFFWNKTTKKNESILVNRRYLEKSFGINIRGKNTPRYISRLTNISENNFSFKYCYTSNVFTFTLIRDIGEWGTKR